MNKIKEAIEKIENSRRKLRWLIPLFIVAAAAVLVVVHIGTKEKQPAGKIEKTVTLKNEKSAPPEQAQELTPDQALAAAKQNAAAKKYPADIAELLDMNPETIDFVNDYALKKDSIPAVDIGADFVAGKIPALVQWDGRWGYMRYGTSHLARSGCGPTALSMVLIGLTGDAGITPAKVAEYAQDNGYVTAENDTLWQFMKEAPANWGVTVSEAAAADENWVKATLQNGGAIICSVGPGNFTEKGHFIVLAAYNNGQVEVRDPFSRANTEKTWGYSDIKDEIKAMWGYKHP